MDGVVVEVVEAEGAMQLVQVPLQASDIANLLATEPHRVTMYIADPQLQLVVGDCRAQFRDLKVDGAPTEFVMCTSCRAVLASGGRALGLVVEGHVCDGTAGLSIMPQDETFVDEFLSRRMNKVSGPANTGFIQEEIRGCFESCRWADVVLVCPQDGYTVRVHGLVLAAASPLLASVLSSLPPIELEDTTIILPSTFKEELIPFLSHIYGQTLDDTDFTSSLFRLIDFNLSARLQEEKLVEVKVNLQKEETIKMVSEADLFSEGFDGNNFISEASGGLLAGSGGAHPLGASEIQRLLLEEPARVNLQEAAGPGRTTKAWGGYMQVLLDGQVVPFLKCRHCTTVLPHTKASSTTAIKKHSRNHTLMATALLEAEVEPAVTGAELRRLIADEPGRVAEYESSGSSDVWHSFRLLSLDGEAVGFARCRVCGVVLAHTPSCGTTSLKKHSLIHLEEGSPQKKRVKLNEDGTATPTKSWDPNFIEGIKNELQAPSQKIKDPETERGPGVSKFAISQLIQAQSPRVTFEESTTHSAVWEKFVKIGLDTVEVPFVCCKFCRKVYTHDRSLGTSSLIRHTCGEEPELDRVTKSGGLPRILVQELVNTASLRISRQDMDNKYDQRLTDVTLIFERVLVDSKDTEYVSCKKCNKLYVFSVTKNSVALVKKLELHECYIKFAPCMTSYGDPQDEKQCFVIYVREPHRIELKEKVKSEPNLHYFLLDGNKTDFAHCTKCCRFFPISSLNFNEERIHRCHKVKTADHNIQFKKKSAHQCDKCQAVFKSEHFLEIHQRREHGEGSATVMCSHCAKEFPTERLAKKHELHVHYPELSKKFSCKDCDAMFHDRSKLKLHAMKHSNIKPYVCEQCGKGFNWIASFQDHMDMHGGVKKYSCEFCNRQFTKRNTLNNHRRLHTGEKPFMCPSPGCGMTFVQRTACKTHAKKRHNIEITMYTRNPEVPQTPASLAQMSLAQRAEQAVLQERVVEQEVVQEAQTVTLVSSGAAGSLGAAGTIQVRGLGQVAGATLQLAQLAGGQVVHILQPVTNERGESMMSLQVSCTIP